MTRSDARPGALSRRRSRRLALAFALAALAAGGARAQAPAAEARFDAKPALTVSVAPVERRPIERVVIGTGSVVAWEQLTIAAESSGLRILDVTVDEGQEVTQGQVLARLDDSILQAQLKAADATIAEMEANLAMAQADLKRAQDLLGSRNIAEQLFEQRQATARAGTARLALAQAQREELRRKIDQTVIRAPTAGIIMKRSALIGSVVNPTTELFRLIRDGRIELDAQVPELDLDVVKPGQRVRVVRGGETYAGTVRLIAPSVDPASRLGIVHIALGRDTPLKPGMFARAEIDVGQATALAVPDAALVFRDGRPGVFALNGENRVALLPVETGLRKAGWVEVTTGIERGQRIVVAGAGFLNDGDLVRVDTAQRATGPTE